MLRRLRLVLPRLLAVEAAQHRAVQRERDQHAEHGAQRDRAQGVDAESRQRGAGRNGQRDRDAAKQRESTHDPSQRHTR